MKGDALDLWLRSSLRQAYDDVAAEPVPEELLELLKRSEA
ncbi:NepR family anti-sigma factor [Falsiroseomonas sp. HW251]